MKRRLDGIYVGNDFQQKNRANPTFESGRFVVKVAKAKFDYSLTDSSGVSNATLGSHGLGVYIPAKAIVIGSWKDIVTAFSCGVAGATAAFTLQSAGDIMATTLTSSGLLSTTGVAQGLITNAAPIKLTAEREITVTVATQNLIAGKATINVAYIEGL